MRPIHLRALDLPLVQLRPGSDQACLRWSDDPDDRWLLESMAALGLLQPLVVHERLPEEYVIVDGHRRYECAQRLGLTALPCLVHPRLAADNYEYLRFMLHDTVKPWTQRESARWRREANQQRSADRLVLAA